MAMIHLVLLVATVLALTEAQLGVFQLTDCTDPTSDSIDQICSAACYDCACGSNLLSPVCYSYCVNFFFSTNIMCKIGATTGVENTPFDACPAQVWTKYPILNNTDYLCEQACKCCVINEGNPNCFVDCKHSTAAWASGVLCGVVAGLTGTG